MAAKQFIEKFQARLPEKLVLVFQKRFLEARTQREAAQDLGVPRTTLVHYERRIRALMHRFAAEVDR
jgi:DNA-directed RNA polymerase specialized sigma24 family protein